MPSSRSGSHSLTLITVGGKPCDVRGGREGRPGQRVALGEGLDPVADRAAVVVQVEQDAVVLRRGRALRRRPLARDVGAQRVEALDEAELAVLLQLEAGGERQVAAAALARDDDAGRVDVEVRRRWPTTHFSPDTQSLSPAGNGATSGTDDGTTELRKSTITTATPLAAMILPQPRYMPS